MKVKTYKVEIYRDSHTIIPVEVSRHEIEILGNVHPKGYITISDDKPVGGFEIYSLEKEAERLQLKYGEQVFKMPFPNSAVFKQVVESEVVADEPQQDDFDMTRDELMQALKEKGVEFKSNASKADLIELYNKAAK